MRNEREENIIEKRKRKRSNESNKYFNCLFLAVLMSGKYWINSLLNSASKQMNNSSKYFDFSVFH